MTLSSCSILEIDKEFLTPFFSIPQIQYHHFPLDFERFSSQKMKTEVHFTSKNHKKGRFHQPDKPPHTNTSTQLATSQFTYTFGGALPFPVNDINSLCAITPNT
jgi:hypothetical protein